ncbi:MAG: tRNA (guanosine(46)-N7)-methyltransferase TrmB [Anaerolineae bacterium]
MLPKLSSLTLPWSTDWTALFGRSAPLILEIGFGYGVYLMHLARTNPQANVIGIEIANRCLNAAENAILREKLDNVRVIYSTAETALHHLFEAQSLSQIHINFPDPWFKRSHTHRRLMQRDTLDTMVSRLAPDGRLYLATDIRDYAEMSADLLAATAGLDNLLDTKWVYEMPERGGVTKYEAAARRAGRPCHYFAYRRNQVPVSAVPVIKDLEMPHVVFVSPLSLDEMLTSFTSHKIADYATRKGTYVSFMDAYRGAHNVLVEVFVKEPTIEQHFAMLITRREAAGEYTLKLSTLGHPRPTAGIHRAAALLRNWLLSLHPDSKVLSDKIHDYGIDSAITDDASPH